MQENNNEEVNKESSPTIKNDASYVQFQPSLLQAVDKFWLKAETKDVMEKVKNLVKTPVITDEFIAELRCLDLNTPLTNIEIAVMQETGLSPQQYDDLVKSMIDTKLESMLNPNGNYFNKNFSSSLYENEGNIFENYGETTTWYADQDGSIHKSL
jgi:hypothetical protein